MDTLLNLIQDSIRRLPVVERSIDEVLWAAYYRISQTEPLIIAQITNPVCINQADWDYWRKGYDEEKDHAQAYWFDLCDYYGSGRVDALRSAYVPCPKMAFHLHGHIATPYELGMYRLYLETAFCAMSEQERLLAEQWLPRTMSIHLAADPTHRREGLEYMARFNNEDHCAEIARIEAALTAEIYHQGFNV
jgi:hypothetical protein